MSVQSFESQLDVTPLRFNANGKEMLYVYPDTKHWAAGWIFYKHPDGQWVTLRKATERDLAVLNSAVVGAHHA